MNTTIFDSMEVRILLVDGIRKTLDEEVNYYQPQQQQNTGLQLGLARERKSENAQVW